MRKHILRAVLIAIMLAAVIAGALISPQLHQPQTDISVDLKAVLTANQPADELSSSDLHKIVALTDSTLAPEDAIPLVRMIPQIPIEELVTES